MQLGISTATFFGKIANENAFDTLRHFGVGVTEVFLSTPCEYTQEFALLMASKRGNITVHSVHAMGTQFEPELFSRCERVRQDAFKMLRQFLQVGQALKAEYYSFHGPLKYKKIPYHIDYDLFAQNLNQIIEVCKEYGIKLAYENVHYSYFDTPGFFEKLKPRCPELYATFDCKHCRQGGGSSEKFLQAIGDRLATVHLCDVNLDNTTTLPYQGVVDFEALFLYLKDHHPKAVLLLELYGHNYQDVSQIKSVYDQTKQHMETVQTKFIKFC